jgi:RNA polymerase sigma-70 factor, ECF subfamily
MILYVYGCRNIIMPNKAALVFKTLPSHGDQEGFDSFFKSFYPRLTAYACLFIENQAAEDIVQDVFVYLWENSSSICIHTSMEAYLFKTIYQRCLNYLKRKKNRNYHHKLIEDYMMEFQTRSFDPDTNESIRKLYMEELKEEIKTAIDSLPDKCREVFMLSYMYHLKNKEISDVLGISLSTVENHIYHALKTLRQKLSSYVKIIAVLFSI